MVKNSGRNYKSIPEITVFGSGTGAKLVPVIVDGKIDKIVVFAKGQGYQKDTTYITVTPAGSGAKLEEN